MFTCLLKDALIEGQVNKTVDHVCIIKSLFITKVRKLLTSLNPRYETTR